jgi:hypothetical protein
MSFADSASEKKLAYPNIPVESARQSYNRASALHSSFVHFKTHRALHFLHFQLIVFSVFIGIVFSVSHRSTDCMISEIQHNGHLIQKLEKITVLVQQSLVSRPTTPS